MKQTLTAIILTLSISGLLAWNNAPAQTQSSSANENTSINWISIQQLSDKVQRRSWKKKKKKVRVDLYTNW